jgi:hypothetical protein
LYPRDPLVILPSQISSLRCISSLTDLGKESLLQKLVLELVHSESRLTFLQSAAVLFLWLYQAGSSLGSDYLAPSRNITNKHNNKLSRRSVSDLSPEGDAFLVSGSSSQSHLSLTSVPATIAGRTLTSLDSHATSDVSTPITTAAYRHIPLHAFVCLEKR